MINLYRLTSLVRGKYHFIDRNFHKWVNINGLDKTSKGDFLC